MKTFNSLEDSCLLIKNITKTIENKIKERYIKFSFIRRYFASKIVVRIGGKTIGPGQDL